MTTVNQKRQLLRHAAVSAVLARVAAGVSTSAAIAEVSTLVIAESGSGKNSGRKKRTLYRWLSRYREKGFDGLACRERVSQSPSRSLSPDFLTYMKARKEEDFEASIPEIIKSAELLGIVNRGEVSRTTAWRAAQRLNLPLLGTQGKGVSTKLRFAYAHRMQMVLCDGKHFRAGVKRKKRVNFTFLDDASRKGLVSVVGTAETAQLFLRGFYKVLRKYGRMTCLYVDNGSGFIAHDVEVICARLGIALIHGTAGYPEGRGKIERWNQTVYKDLLRTFAGDPSVDDSCESLELRTEHYVREVYNQQKHEGLSMRTPQERWQNDTKALEPIQDLAELEQHFVLSLRRKVSADNIVKLGGKAFEMPLGYAGTTVVIDRDYLHETYYFLHQGKLQKLAQVSMTANARAERVKQNAHQPKEVGPAVTAARIAFQQSFEPLVNITGDFYESKEER